MEPPKNQLTVGNQEPVMERLGAAIETAAPPGSQKETASSDQKQEGERGKRHRENVARHSTRTWARTHVVTPSIGR